MSTVAECGLRGLNDPDLTSGLGHKQVREPSTTTGRPNPYTEPAPRGESVADLPFLLPGLPSTESSSLEVGVPKSLRVDPVRPLPYRSCPRILNPYPRVVTLGPFFPLACETTPRSPPLPPRGPERQDLDSKRETESRVSVGRGLWVRYPGVVVPTRTRVSTHGRVLSP